MLYEIFLDKIIEDGIKAASESYKDKPDKLKGSIEGFEKCRGKSPADILQLLNDAREASRVARLAHDPHFWTVRCCEMEIEWVANCVSACLRNQGLPTIVTPTARGMMKAAQVVGVSAPS